MYCEGTLREVTRVSLTNIEKEKMRKPEMEWEEMRREGGQWRINIVCKQIEND